MYFQEIGPILSSVDEPMALCTVVATKGSTPRKAGARMIVTQSGTVYGTVGGGHFEQKVVVQALEVIQSGTPGMFRHELLQQHDMCCGGTMEVFIERMERKKKLYIFGAGHTGQALSRFAVEAGFDVWLVDDREAYLSRCSDPRIHCVLQNFEDALRSLKFDADAFVVVMTYRHDIDRQILALCIRQPHAYLGMIGSRRKILVTKKRFRDAGIATVHELDAVDMPTGLAIGADGPAEIAVSILAKLIAVKNNVNP
ncbi:MAG: XdhC family protein [Saprospiraceae bacterium]|jgi:xanthine dehydrogenase accessory factor|nr:XdhC family protein [Saprospiraceae bacterium]MBP9209325.1 XdhC family protein [Saprospiraceae bacterium]MBV6474267.1 hypothetical protein [Saprospiraceae bacterium]